MIILSDNAKHVNNYFQVAVDWWANTGDETLREFGHDCRSVDPVTRNIGMDAINQPVQQDFVLTTELLKSQKPEKRFGLCPILLPDSKDYQQDVITAEEIEKAVWGMKLSDGLLDDEHTLSKNLKIGDVVEKYILPADTLFAKSDKYSPENQARVEQIAELQKAIADSGEARLLPKGTGMLGTIYSPDYWKKIQKGEKTGFSIYGRGVRKRIETGEES